MTHIEKVRYLRGIATGEIRINQLPNTVLSIWYNLEPDVYTGGPGMTLTKAGFDAYQKENTSRQYITYRIQAGNDPLVTNV
jgi:hypothetical protein